MLLVALSAHVFADGDSDDGDPPSQRRGATVLRYEVLWFRTNRKDAQPQTRMTTKQVANIRNVVAGKVYTVQVRSFSADTSSEWSAAQTVTVWKLPAAPRIYGFAPGLSDLRVLFFPPIERGIPALSGFEAQYRADGTDAWTSQAVSVSSTVAAISGLTRGETYEVRMRALSLAGDGPWSAIKSITLPLHTAAPAVPMDIVVTPSDSVAGQLDVGWTMPIAAEGEEPQRYHISYYKTGTRTASISTTTTHSVALSGLIGGESYDVQVRAANSLGHSHWSAAVSATAPPRQMYSHPILNRVTTGNQSLTIDWSPPAEPGLPRYTSMHLLYQRKDSSDEASSIRLSDSPHTLMGLENGVTYTLRLFANGPQGKTGDRPSSRGEGAPAEILDPPAAPTLTVTPRLAGFGGGLGYTPGQLALSWTDEASGSGRALSWELSYTTPDAEAAPSYCCASPGMWLDGRNGVCRTPSRCGP